jgi:hypothetical protein
MIVLSTREQLLLVYSLLNILNELVLIIDLFVFLDLLDEFLSGPCIVYFVLLG